MDWTGLTLVVDVDGTLCPIRGSDQNYSDLIPYGSIVERLRTYHEEGVRIVIYSSRNMNTFGGNMGLINKNMAPVMLEWLDRHMMRLFSARYGPVISDSMWMIGQLGLWNS